MPNALAVLAVAERGAMFDPSAVFYMEKLAVGPEAADVVDITAPGGREHPPGGQGQGASRSPTSPSACSTGRATPTWSPRSGARGARIRLHLRRRRGGRDLGGPPEHRRRHARRHRRHPRGHHRRGRAEVHGRGDPGQAVAARRRGARSGRSTPGTTWTGCSPPTTWCAATTCSSAPPASPTATCCAACATGPVACTTQSIVMRSKSRHGPDDRRVPPPDEAAGVLVGRLRPDRRAARRGAVRCCPERPGVTRSGRDAGRTAVLPRCSTMT